MRTPPLLFASLVLAACSRTPEPPTSDTPKPSAQSATAEQKAPAPNLSSEASAGTLAWEHRAPLVRRVPKSAMRAAEYGVEGDPSAELSVFYFGPNQGGDVESNVQRWVGQLKPGANAAAPQRATREVGKVVVHTVEAAGGYSGGMGMPGMAAPAPIDDALMLGAIAEVAAEGGAPVRVFFKLVGPRASVESARSAFNALLDSLRIEAP